jgi:hypothetical protein
MEDEFLSPELQPIPDDAPQEVPRITFESTHGHSNLSLTPVRSDLRTQYDDEYHGDIDGCLQYIQRKSKSIDLVSDTLSPQLAFFAIRLKIRWSQNKSDTAGVVNELRNRLASKRYRDQDFRNIALSYSVDCADDLFKMVELSNYRVFSADQPLQTPHPRIEKDLKQVDHGLEKEVEVNDRKAYNAGNNSSGTDQIEEFLEIIAEEIKFPLPE